MKANAKLQRRLLIVGLVVLSVAVVLECVFLAVVLPLL